MRVLHVHAGNIYGGVETVLLTHVRQRSLCPAMEASFALCFAGRFSEELAAEGARVEQLGAVRIRQPLSVRRARRNLKDLLRREIFNVIVTHSCWSQAVFGPTVRAAGVPLAFYLHAPPDGKHWLERLAQRTPPDLIVCNSNFTAASAPLLYPGGRLETVYCPVAPPKEIYSEENARLIRAELQTPKDATVIIQVSRMEALKGQVLHLEALSLLKELPGWVCWQVGGAQQSEEVQYLEELKITANRLGIAHRVRFLNERSDVASLMAAADIYCQPNTHPDSFGITFIEALNAELPVVTTAFGGACEIVDHSCGVLVPPSDSVALAAALRQLIVDQTVRTKLGDAGPARARQLCDPEARMNQFHNLVNCTRQVRSA